MDINDIVKSSVTAVVAVIAATTLGNHPKPAIDNHFKTGHREAA
jgi:hypothetical protein